MDSEFKVSQQMSKKELIEAYETLLDAYQEKVREAKEAAKRRSEPEKQAATAALAVAKDASVQGVVDTIGQLRGLVSRTLNDLTERMAAAAEKLERLNAAIVLKEARLKDLSDMGEAADALDKLAGAYEERKQAAEADYAKRLAEMEAGWKEKASELEGDYSERKEQLSEEMDRMRVSWKTEQEGQKKAVVEEKAQTKKEREREEAEYLYERDRSRKIEEHQYQEKKTTLDKQLKEQKESATRELDERENAVAGREKDLDDLRKQVDKFPQTLQKEIEQARKEVRLAIEKEAEHAAALVAVERDWEKKVYEQKVQHQDGLIADAHKKNGELRAELTAALTKVQQIADKAVEGASHSRAFQSVNQIALEQARRPEGKSGKE